MHPCGSTSSIEGQRYVVRTTLYFHPGKRFSKPDASIEVCCQMFPGRGSSVSMESRICMVDAHVKDVYLSNCTMDADTAAAQGYGMKMGSGGASLTNHGCFGVASGREGKTVVPVWNVQRQRRTRQAWRHDGTWHKLCTNVLI
ncbi:hypothetical protein BDZ85DRAFT_36168 [Elsinoe ampelina]|uniref:Uncharacterized protein n=1 Tax=Elsinoe ampelina TaxID=302913 RepID=A0A6A6G379_9PEZI|nr:hypothetical protein BDZ85DRAFT_36168 [Elsinoe ampelina]